MLPAKVVVAKTRSLITSSVDYEMAYYLNTCMLT